MMLFIVKRVSNFTTKETSDTTAKRPKLPPWKAGNLKAQTVQYTESADQVEGCSEGDWFMF